jgi:hypothetical protein
LIQNDDQKLRPREKGMDTEKKPSKCKKKIALEEVDQAVEAF